MENINDKISKNDLKEIETQLNITKDSINN